MHKSLIFKVITTIYSIIGIVLISIVIAILVNVFRNDGIPFITDTDYLIYEPCPEPTGKFENISINDVLKDISEELTINEVLIIDASSENIYNKGHLVNAISIPYSFLDTIDKEKANKLVNLRPKRIYVYGNLDNDLSLGKLLAGEIASLGLNNIYWISSDYNEIKKYFVTKK